MKKLIARKKIVFIGLAIIMVISGVLSMISREKGTAVTANAEITNWGLSFQNDGEAPLANASSEYLAEYGALYKADTQEKTIYLTFDAGFENGNTSQILEALKKHNVKATFFLVGNYFETASALVKQMVDEGHTIANHTYSHPDMSKISDKDSFLKELQKNETVYKSITGKDMLKIYRPPQGKFSESNLQMAHELSYRTIFWSLAYVDWYENDQPTKEKAFAKLLPRVHPGTVVLLHSTSKTNAAIFDELLTKWEEMGYGFGNLEEYLQNNSSDNSNSEIKEENG